MNLQQLKNVIEAALLTAGGPLPMVRLQALFSEAEEQPESDQIKQVIEELGQEYNGRGIELKQVSSGFRIQAKQEMGQWLNRLSEDKPSRYSRALLETLALIAYRQPITRGGVEDIRGVSVSSSIIKTLLEREWIRVVGHRDVPGRPALYGTTRQFLDYFNLQTLGELPPLSEMRSIEDIQSEFDLNFNKPMDTDNSDTTTDFNDAEDDSTIQDGDETTEHQVLVVNAPASESHQDDAEISASDADESGTEQAAEVSVDPQGSVTESDVETNENGESPVASDNLVATSTG